LVGAGIRVELRRMVPKFTKSHVSCGGRAYVTPYLQDYLRDSIVGIIEYLGGR
jgi:hypothetical protein